MVAKITAAMTYKVLVVKDEKKLEKELNELAGAGWEVIGSVGNTVILEQR